ncbi:9356_t:CDS:1, partial [Scutellospora calospora]
NKIPSNKKSSNPCCNVVNSTKCAVKRMDEDDEKDQVVEDSESCDEKSTGEHVQTSYHKPNGISYYPSTIQNSPSFTPDTIPSMKHNKQPQLLQLESRQSFSINDLILKDADEIMKDPIFCTTGEGDICFCDPDKEGERLIISKEIVQYTASIYDTTLPLNKSCGLQQDSGYCAQSPPTSSTTSSTADKSRNHHFDLNWILHTSREDPNCDDNK